MKKTRHRNSPAKNQKQVQPAQRPNGSANALGAAFKRLNGAGPAAQAVLLASLLLVASAVFLSQTDQIFAKAANTNIRGTIVLTDKSGFTFAYGYAFVPTNVVSTLALPGTSCNVQIAACNHFQNYLGSDRGTQSIPQVGFDGVILRPGAPAQTITVPSVQEVCVTTDILTNVAGGIHTVQARNQQFTAIPNVQSLTVAYDCTP